MASSPIDDAPVTAHQNQVRKDTSWLPSWARSARFRLTVLYSLMLFGLGSMVLGLIYLALYRNMSEAHVLANDAVTSAANDAWQNDVIASRTELLVNQRALGQLQRYSLISLVGLFVGSLGVGWFVAGQVLSPIGRITKVVREITATDLSRRIRLGGPDDELKQLADTFDDMLARLDQSFAGQRRLVHEASHELRNPLAVIRTNLDVTLSDPKSDLEDYKHTTEVVARNADRMIKLVDDLLAFARQDARATYDEPVDITDLVCGVGDEFAPAAEAREIDIEVDTMPGLWIQGDQDALHQALANLVSNSLNYAPEASSLSVAAGQDQGFVWIAVEDEGPGIAKADQSRVFERGFRGKQSKGSGLGLAIVRQIVERHNGEVKLTSNPGRGARFSIWIPALVSSDLTKDTGELQLGDNKKIESRPSAGDASTETTDVSNAAA